MLKTLKKIQLTPSNSQIICKIFMHILFICSANKDRSKSAEDYFSEQYPDHHFDSAGTNLKTCQQLGTNYIEEEQLALADRIYVMETKHSQAIQQKFGNTFHRKITVLHIKDHYQYGDPELLEILSRKVKF